MDTISTDNAPAAIGPYSQAIRANGLLFASGQIPVDPATGKIPEGIAAQAEQSCRNCGALLAAAGLDFSASPSATSPRAASARSRSSPSPTDPTPPPTPRPRPRAAPFLSPRPHPNAPPRLAKPSLQPSKLPSVRIRPGKGPILHKSTSFSETLKGLPRNP